MKKFMMWLAPLMLAGTIVFAVQSSASATQTQCSESQDTSTKLCAVFSKDAGNTGFTLDRLIGSCKPFWFGTEPIAGWDDIAIDGHGLQVWRWDSGAQVQKVNITDANSNVHLDSGGDHVCTRTWQIDQHWPDMNTMLIRWDFTEQKNHSPDVLDVIQMSFTNAG